MQKVTCGNPYKYNEGHEGGKGKKMTCGNPNKKVT